MGTDADNKVCIYTSDGTEIVKLDFVDMAFEGESCGDNDILSISPNGECFFISSLRSSLFPCEIYWSKTVHLAISLPIVYLLHRQD